MTQVFRIVSGSILMASLLQVMTVFAAPTASTILTAIDSARVKHSSGGFPLQKHFPFHSDAEALNTHFREARSIQVPATCPVYYPHNRKIVVAGIQTNAAFMCDSHIMRSDNNLPFWDLDGGIYNNRSFSSNYYLDYGFMVIRTFSMEMNDTCLKCIRESDTEVGLMPNGIGHNIHITALDCHTLGESGDCPNPYNEGKPTITDFHRSGLNGDRFEFHYLENIAGCTAANHTYELIVDLCGKKEWAISDDYIQSTTMHSLAVSNPHYPANKRYSGILKRDAAGNVCAVDRMLNTIAPDFTKTTHHVNNNAKVCIDIPMSPKASQYILATAASADASDDINGPEGRCSCNLVNDDYLHRCICTTGTPALKKLDNGTTQVCFTNANNALNDSVIYFTKDTDGFNDSYVCDSHRTRDNPAFYSNNYMNHSLFLEEHRINPSPR